MADKALEEWKKRALEAEAALKQVESALQFRSLEFEKQYKIQKLLIAAGFITEEKVREAETLLESL